MADVSAVSCDCSLREEFVFQVQEVPGFNTFFSDWLLDTGADVHVMPAAEWRRLGCPALETTSVVLGSASGENLEAIGALKVRAWADDQKVELDVIVAERVKRCLLSGTRLRTKGYKLSLSTESFLEKNGKRVQLRREGARDVLRLRILRKADASVVTMSGLRREVSKVKKEIKNMRTGMPETTGIDESKPFTAEERRKHEQTSHAVYDPRCEICVQTRGVARHPRRVEEESVNFDYATVKSVNGSQVHTLLIGGGPRGETFARRVPRKGAKFEDLEIFLEVMKQRYGAITIACDQEDSLVQVVKPAALKKGLPVTTTALEQSQSNGRAEQRVRAMKERLQISVLEARSRGVEILDSGTLTSWAVRHAEWVANFLVKSDVELVDGSVIKVSPYEAHTGKNPPRQLAAFMERILVKRRDRDDPQPRWQVSWLLGFVEADVQVLQEDGTIRRHGDWRHSPEANSEADKKEVEAAAVKVKELKMKTPGCSTCEEGPTRQNYGRHSVPCQERVHPPDVAPSMWKVAIDSNGRRLRGEDAEAEVREPKRARPEEPAGAGASSSSGAAASSSSGPAASAPSAPSALRFRLTSKRAPPEARDEGEGPERRQRTDDGDVSMNEVMKMIGVVQQYTADALEKVNEQMHQPEELKDETLMTSPEARHKEITNFEDLKVFKEVHRTKDMKVISGKWVEKKDPDGGPGVKKARWVLRGFEEKADRDDCYAATASLPSVRMMLAFASSMKSDEYRAYIGDVIAAFLNANMAEGEKILAQPPPEWQPRHLSPTKGEVVWELLKALYGLKTSPVRWQKHLTQLLLEDDFQQHPQDACVFVKKTATGIIMLCCHVDDLLVVGKEKDAQQFFENLSKKVQIKYKEVTGATKYLGRRLEKCDGGYTFGVEPTYVENIINENGFKDLKGTSEIKWAKDHDEEETLDGLGQAEFRSVVGQLMWVDRTDVRKPIGKLATKLGKATSTDRQNVVNVLRYLKGTPRTMTVNGIKFDEDVLARAKPGAIFVEADADWAGDKDRLSTSGIIVYVKGHDQLWYLVQAVSRKQSTVALSSGEAELISILSGTCELRGVSMMWSWLMAGGIMKDVEIHEEIVGSDSTVALSILRRKGATRRTKHVEMKAFFLQNYCQQAHVKLLKIATENMLADSLTKVMNMPAHHVAKCGLKPVRAVAAVVAIISQVEVVEAVSSDLGVVQEDEADDLWPLLRLMLMVFAIGAVLGTCLGMKIGRALANRQRRAADPALAEVTASGTARDSSSLGGDASRTARDSSSLGGEAVPVPTVTQRVRTVAPSVVFVTEKAGKKFHSSRTCTGLNNAIASKMYTPCQVCYGSDREGV